MPRVAPTLAVVLTRLIRNQRVSYAHIARIGHLSRNTVALIAKGETPHPTADTLCRIAVGLAADPYTGRIDQDAMVMALDDLGAVSGHGDLRDAWVRQTLPVLLATIVGSLDAATAWVELIAAHPDANPAQVRALAAELARRLPPKA